MIPLSSKIQQPNSQSPVRLADFDCVDVDAVLEPTVYTWVSEYTTARIALGCLGNMTVIALDKVTSILRTDLLH